MNFDQYPALKALTEARLDTDELAELRSTYGLVSDEEAMRRLLLDYSLGYLPPEDDWETFVWIREQPEMAARAKAIEQELLASPLRLAAQALSARIGRRFHQARLDRAEALESVGPDARTELERWLADSRTLTARCEELLSEFRRACDRPGIPATAAPEQVDLPLDPGATHLKLVRTPAHLELELRFSDRVAEAGDTGIAVEFGPGLHLELISAAEQGGMFVVVARLPAGTARELDPSALQPENLRIVEAARDAETLLERAASASLVNASDALTILGEIYWYPVYAFLHRSGVPTAEAIDHTLEFFARIIKRGDMTKELPNPADLRSYVLAAAQEHLAKAHTQPAGEPVPPINPVDAEAHNAAEFTNELAPAKLHENNSTRILLERAIQTVRGDYLQRSSLAEFEALLPVLAERNEAALHQTAATLNLAREALTSALHRLRREIQDSLMREISRAGTQPAELKAELRTFYAALPRSL